MSMIKFRKEITALAVVVKVTKLPKPEGGADIPLILVEEVKKPNKQVGFVWSWRRDDTRKNSRK